jgi:hypothetical protein
MDPTLNASLLIERLKLFKDLPLTVKFVDEAYALIEANAPAELIQQIKYLLYENFVRNFYAIKPQEADMILGYLQDLTNT